MTRIYEWFAKQRYGKAVLGIWPGYIEHSCGCVTAPWKNVPVEERIWIEYCGGSPDDCQAMDRIP